MLLRILQMVLQCAVGHSGSDQSRHREQAARLYIDGRIVPDLAEQEIIIGFGKKRCKLTQCLTPCRLNDFFHNGTLSLLIPCILQADILFYIYKYSKETSPDTNTCFSCLAMLYKHSLAQKAVRRGKP